MKKLKVRIGGVTPYLQKLNCPYKDSKGDYCVPSFEVRESLLEAAAMKSPRMRDQMMRCVEIKPEHIKLKYKKVSEKEIEGEKFLMFEGWGAEFEAHLAEDVKDLDDIEKKEIEEILRMWGK